MICVAKTKVLISCVVTAQLICIFVFAYAKSCFSDDAAQLSHLCLKSLPSSFQHSTALTESLF